MRNYIVIAILGLLFASSCKKDEDSAFAGTEQELIDFYSPEVVDALNQLGLTINSGTTPPSLSGTFFVSPLLLTDTNIPGESTGVVFNDFLFTFSEQNNSTNNIDLQGASLDGSGNISETFTAEGSSFISGTNNDFTVFGIILGVDADTEAEAEVAYVISGQIADTGIVDFELAIVMLDDKGDPFGFYIDNGSGRRFVDSDGLADRLLTGKAPVSSDKRSSVRKNILGILNN